MSADSTDKSDQILRFERQAAESITLGPTALSGPGAADPFSTTSEVA